MISVDLIREFNEFRGSPPGAPICAAPLINLHFSQLGVVTACCFNRAHVLGTYPKNSIEDIWNGSATRELREALASNDLSKGCEKCLQQIEARDFGGSHAAFYTRFAQEQARSSGTLPSTSEVPNAPRPMKLEFNIHNSCNLECVMCHGLASSAIRTRRDNLPVLPNPYDEAFVDQLEPFLPHVIQADFLGGEPFLIPAYRQLWERMARVSPKTKILILTNGTILDDRIKALLERLNVTLHMSIDSDVKETYESIRRGADFDRVMAHADYFRELMARSGQPLLWRYCPMRINWREMPETLRNCNRKGILLHFNQLDFPINLSLTTLPYDQLREVVEYLAERAPGEPVNHIERWNRSTWFELVDRLRAFLQPDTRLGGLVARLDTGSAVVGQYSPAREGELNRRLAMGGAEAALTDAAKSFFITRLNLDQAIANEPEVPEHLFDRLTQRTTDVLAFAADLPAPVFARIFLDELVRACSWGAREVHDEKAYDRIAEFAAWIGGLADPSTSVAAIVSTPPAQLYHLFGLSASLEEARGQFGAAAVSPRGA